MPLPRSARLLLAALVASADGTTFQRALPEVKGAAADILQALSAGQGPAVGGAAAAVEAPKVPQRVVKPVARRSIAKPIASSNSVPTFKRDVRARRAAVGFGAARARVRRAALEAKAAAWDEERVGWDSEDKAEADKSLKAAKDFRALVRNVTRSQNMTSDHNQTRWIHVSLLQEQDTEGDPTPADRKPSDEFRKTTGMIFEAVREVRGAAFDVAHGGVDKEVLHEIEKLDEASVELVLTVTQVISWASEHLAEDEVASNSENPAEVAQQDSIDKAQQDSLDKATDDVSKAISQHAQERAAKSAPQDSFDKAQQDTLDKATDDVSKAIGQHAQERAAQKAHARKRAEKKANAIKKLASTTDDVVKAIDQSAKLAKAQKDKLDKTTEEATKAITQHTRDHKLQTATDKAANAIKQHELERARSVKIADAVKQRELERARSIKIDEVKRAVAAISQADRKLDVSTKGLDDAEIAAVVQEVDSAAADLAHIEGHILAKIIEGRTPKAASTKAAAGEVAKASPWKAASTNASAVTQPPAAPKAQATSTHKEVPKAPSPNATKGPLTIKLHRQRSTPAPKAQASPPVAPTNATTRSAAAPPPPSAAAGATVPNATFAADAVEVNATLRKLIAGAISGVLPRKAANATAVEKAAAQRPKAAPAAAKIVAANASLPKKAANATAVSKAAVRPTAVPAVPVANAGVVRASLDKKEEVVIVEASPKDRIKGGRAKAKERDHEEKVVRDEQDRDQEEAQHHAGEKENRESTAKAKAPKKTKGKVSSKAPRIVQERVEELREDAEREEEERQEEFREQEQVEEDVKAEEDKDMEDKEQEEMQHEEDDRERRELAEKKKRSFLQQSRRAA